MKKISLILAALFLMSLAAGCQTLPGTVYVPSEQDSREQTGGEPEPPEAGYARIGARELKDMIEEGADKIILDIQPEEYFNLRHLPGAISAGAYPADTDELRAKLDPCIKKIKKSEAPVIIVGMGGRTGAENAADYCAEQGVDAGRLKILEGGAMSWPYPELKWAVHEYQYITAEQLKARFDKKEGAMIIDLRLPDIYDAGHIEGAIPTYSSPNVKREQWDKLEALREDIEKTLDPVVLISNTGGDGAENAVCYYAVKGVNVRKFYILKGGSNAWQYEDMLVRTPRLQYISPADFKAKQEAGEEMLLLSVQTKESYRETGHLPGSIPAYACPGDAAEFKGELKKAQGALAEKPELPIYVMDIDGGRDAVNAVACCVNRFDMDDARFFIIEGGIKGWPYPEMLALGR